MRTKIDKKQVFIIHARPLMPLPWQVASTNKCWSATRGATFAIKKGKLGRFYMGLALCGKKDNFNRKIGRTIAQQRLEKQKFWHSKKGLSSVIDEMRKLCAKQGFVLPVKSLVYMEETFNGKGD